MTDISLSTLSEQVENLSWNLTPPHGEFRGQGTLDVSLFNAAQHYPNGFIPSGCIVAVKTSGGKIGPYLDSLSNGQEVAVGILSASIQVLNASGTAKTLIGVAFMTHGRVSIAALPFLVGTQALGGYYDAAAKADLARIEFAA